MVKKHDSADWASLNYSELWPRTVNIESKQAMVRRTNAEPQKPSMENEVAIIKETMIKEMLNLRLRLNGGKDQAGWRSR